MDLFLNYKESFQKVKKRYLEIQEKNTEWRDANMESLKEMSENSSGEWSTEYQEAAQSIIEDYDLFTSRIDTMCETFELAEKDVIAMLNRCAQMQMFLDTDIMDVMERCSDLSLEPYAQNDLMYNSSRTHILLKACENIFDKNELETQKLGEFDALFDKLHHVDKTFMDSDIQLMTDGIKRQNYLVKFEDNFTRFTNEVSDFNTTYSSSFADVVGEYTDFPEFERTNNLEAYVEKHYPKVKKTATKDGSELFDNDGMYGGDQGHPVYVRYDDEAYLDWIRTQKGFENMTDEEIKEYLATLNENGCGYVAVVNAILFAYEDDPKAFEEKYGIPLYDENGDLNYDKLLFIYYTEVNHKVYTDSPGARDAYAKSQINYYCEHPDEFKEKYGIDLYADEEKGTINPDAYQIFLDDYDKAVANNPKELEVLDGANNDTSQVNRADHFAAEHGDSLEVIENVSVNTLEDFQEYTSEGYVIVLSAEDFTMYNMDGTPYNNGEPVGGHAMVVTGVTADGRLIVSSWGEEYIVDLEDATRASTTAYRVDTDPDKG